MARKHQVTVPGSADSSTGELILPRHLLGSAAHAERERWLRDHGVDVADFAAFRRILSASEVHHGLPDSSSLARMRRRAESGQRHLPASKAGGE